MLNLYSSNTCSVYTFALDTVIVLQEFTELGQYIMNTTQYEKIITNTKQCRLTVIIGGGNTVVRNSN